MTTLTGVDANGAPYTEYDVVYADAGQVYLAGYRVYENGNTVEYPEIRVSDRSTTNTFPAITSYFTDTMNRTISVVVWRETDQAGESRLVYRYIMYDILDAGPMNAPFDVYGENGSDDRIISIEDTDNTQPAIAGWNTGGTGTKEIVPPDGDNNTPQTEGFIVTWRDDDGDIQVWTRFDEGDEPTYTINASGAAPGHPAIGIPDNNGEEPFFITYAAADGIHLRRLVAPANLSDDSPIQDRHVTDDLGYLKDNATPQLSFGEISGANTRTVYIAWTGVKEYHMRATKERSLLRPPDPEPIPDPYPVRTTWVRAIVERYSNSIPEFKQPYNLLHWPAASSYPHAAKHPSIAGPMTAPGHKVMVWECASHLATQAMSGTAAEEDFAFESLEAFGTSGNWPAVPIRMTDDATELFWTAANYDPSRIAHRALDITQGGLQRAAVDSSAISPSDVAMVWADLAQTNAPPSFRQGHLFFDWWPVQINSGTSVSTISWKHRTDSINASTVRTAPIIADGQPVTLHLIGYGAGFPSPLPSAPHTLYQLTLRNAATDSVVSVPWQFRWRDLADHLVANDTAVTFHQTYHHNATLPDTGPDSVYFALDRSPDQWSGTQTGAHLLVSGEPMGGAPPGIPPAASIPGETTLNAAFPNPFNPVTSVDYTLHTTQPVDIAIYNLLGQRVTTLVHTRQSPGTYTIQWHGASDSGVQQASGVYFLVFQANEKRITRKLMLLR